MVFAGMAAIYGFEVDTPAAEQSIEDFLPTRYPGPVVGDRAELGNVAFVVRVVAGNRITQVGLKLQP